MSAGDVPGYTVVTKKVGTTTSGNCSLGMVLYTDSPASVIITVRMKIVIRLSMAQLVGLNSLNELMAG